MFFRKTVPLLFLIVCINSSIVLHAQAKFTISGTIKNKFNGETLIGASVKLDNHPGGTTTNEYGFYSLTVQPKQYNLIVTVIGMKPDTITINIRRDTLLNVFLEDFSKELNEVIVKGSSKGRAIAGTQMGIERLSISEIKNVPVIMGEKDVLKTIQLLPGIKSAGNGSAGFYVRGGAADQNQVLLDEANVYNAAHLLGFFSVFNSDAIKDVTIYKGGMPAQYGGRLSSVVDVKMNDGNNKDYNVSGGIGIISAKLNVEGPLQENKSSFLLSGRRTYADLFLRASSDTAVKSSKLYFYDFNAKANYELGSKDRIYLSGYFGKDVLGDSKEFLVDWGNATGTLRWNHVFNKRLFSNTSFIYSNYNYNILINNNAAKYKIFSQIRDRNLKQDYQLNGGTRNTFRFGWSSSYHILRPGETSSSDSADKTSFAQSRRYSLENAVYFSDTWKASEKFTVTYGARLTAFSIMGKGDFYTINNDGKVLDTISYKEGQFVKTYWNAEPRLALGYQLNHNSSIKASFVRNVQNMHLISSSTVTLPTDKWTSSSNNVKPGISDQVSLGYYRNLADNKYELTVEGYYKSLQNQIDYRDGADIFSREPLETNLLYGIGRAYGVEWLLRKKTGRLTGWVGYTISKSERKINGINNDQWYNARQDRTHDISIVGMYPLNKKWIVSANWVYYTGDAITFPNGKYTVGGQTVYYYTNRNGYRMPVYHRLDLGATMQLKQKRRWKSELAFGLYNAYGRENAYSITFRDNKDDPNKTEAVQTSLFRWVPSISYNFKF